MSFDLTLLFPEMSFEEINNILKKLTHSLQKINYGSLLNSSR